MSYIKQFCHNHNITTNDELKKHLTRINKLSSNDKNLDINLILNYLKPWQDWSLLSLSNDNDFKQYIKNAKVIYDGKNITFTQGTNSYFTNSEITYIKTFLEIIENRNNLGLSLDYSINSEFENKTKHKNFINDIKT